MNAISQISSDLNSAMVVDLASGMYTEAEVFQSYGFSPEDGAKLLRQDWFKKMLVDTRADWNSITNARQRVKLKSQIALEETITDIYAIVKDKNIPAAARVAAFKELKDISGVGGATAAEGTQGSGPQVNIFLRGDKEPSVSISTTPKREVAEEPEFIDMEPITGDDSAGFFLGMD